MSENKGSKIIRWVGFISYLVTGYCMGWLISESLELEAMQIVTNE